MFNTFSLSATERKKRTAFRCAHHHNGIYHPNCYNKHYGITERIGFYDIETSNLNADFGIILSYCILSNKGKLYHRIITPEEIKSGVFDKNLLKQLCKDVRNFDRIIGYYSSRFDAPFLRTRSIYHRLQFPIYKEISHTDAYMVAKHKLLLHSRRLGVVAPFFGIKAKGHPLNGNIWLQCLSGDKKALDFVLTHNKEDVYSLRDLWHRIEKYTQLHKTSI
jgi:uncharacterized protein YprB with RNaseH-like and TPR domain